MAQSKHLKLVDDYAKWVKERRDNNVWSLNYKRYKKRIDDIVEFEKRFEGLEDYNSNLEFTSLPYEEKLFKTDTILKEKRDRWHKSLSKDVYVEEALNVLEDLKANNIKNDKLAIKN